LGHHIDRAGHRESETNESWLAGNFHADGRRLLLLVGDLLLVQLTLGLARAAHEFIDHFLRQPRVRTLPAVRQEVDIKAFSGCDRIDLYLLRQRNSDCTAVRISPCRADIARGTRVEFLDRNRNRLLEVDDNDRAGDAHAGFDRLVEMKQESCKTPVGRDLDVALDRIVGARAQTRGSEKKKKTAKAVI